jgi:subtilase family serine protease
MADGGNVMAESDETNNTFCTNGTVQVTEPDLAMTAVTPTTATLSPKATLSVANTVINQGAISAGSFVVTFDLSPTASYADPGAVAIPITRKVNSRKEPSTATTKQASSTRPPVLIISVQGRPGQRSGELDEDNNTQCSPSPVTVPVSD